ncbi:MAG: Holliday junction resolvase RuvX [Mollicutes bacterium PWAP]|nr:Holliday junction resolvase RuvX [Mollicutes bacterium PWAP]
MRKLGLDIGHKSCGFAVTDELNITVQGIDNYFYPEYKYGELIQEILRYLKKYEIILIVVGMPTLPSGKKTETSFYIEEVVEVLKNLTNIKIVFADENMSTKRAMEILQKLGHKVPEARKKKDMVAAQLILEDYIKWGK